MDYDLPNIPFLKLKFLMEAGQETSLPIMKGSMLRGAFGHALRRTVCVMGREQTCETCMLRRQCVYTRIFETFIEGDPPPFLKGLKTSPRPFIIDAYDGKNAFKMGEALEFDMTLIGSAADLHPYVIFAMARAAERGFTRRRLPFRLIRVDWMNEAWHLLYDGGKQCLCGMAKPTMIPEDGRLESPIHLRFLTPTRLKINNIYTMDFTFRMLVGKMVRRILEIAYFHVLGAEPDWDFHGLLEKADRIKVPKNKLYWDDWERYSSRQKSRMTMGGFIGEMVLEGDLAPFGKLLRTSEVLHVGKGTVFGLGKVRVE